MIKKSSILMLLVIINLTACQSNLKYKNIYGAETINGSFSSKQLESIIKNMVSSMVTASSMLELPANKIPIIFIDSIKNNTSEHIDMESVSRKIGKQLLLTGKFSLIDESNVNHIRHKFNYQNNSRIGDPSAAINFGKQVGAEYMLYGKLTNLENKTNNVNEINYKMIMRLMDLKTGLIEWSDEKEIKKIN